MIIPLFNCFGTQWIGELPGFRKQYIFYWAQPSPLPGWCATLKILSHKPNFQALFLNNLVMQYGFTIGLKKFCAFSPEWINTKWKIQNISKLLGSFKIPYNAWDKWMKIQQNHNHHALWLMWHYISMFLSFYFIW